MKIYNLGVISIHAGLGNIIIALLDQSGNVLKQSSAGQLGYKKSKRGTAFAGQVVMNHLLETIHRFNITSWAVHINGLGASKDGALKIISQAIFKEKRGSSRDIPKRGLRIHALRDVTPLPHNGCRAPSLRRI